MKQALKFIKDYGGTGIGCVVFAVLLVLKVTEVINWSWWWIVAPLWIPLAIDIMFSVVYVVYQIYLTKERNKKSEE